MMTGLYEYRHGCNFSHGHLEQRFIENSIPCYFYRGTTFIIIPTKIGTRSGKLALSAVWSR